MSGEASPPRRYLGLYSAAWIALVTIYCAALVASDISTGLALRNAIANLLPDGLLGLAVLRLPSFVRWPEQRKGRFFAAHLGFLAAFFLIAGAGWITLVAVDSLLFTGHLPARINFRYLPFRLLNDLLIYCTLAGVAYARQNAEAVREHAERVARAEALRARASLEAMRSQLNPHFILNTFHALVGLVRREPAVAENALERLGDLLRYSLRIHRDGIDEVPLREECAFASSYLALEQLRLAERLRVSVDIPAATLECLVPTFALQILAENAIRHGIAPRAAGGLVQIRAHAIDGRLRVAVQDEGLGEAADARFDGSRMGLRILEERLAALYGGDARLALRRIEGGTCAELELPARRTTEERA